MRASQKAKYFGTNTCICDHLDLNQPVCLLALGF